MEQKDASSEAAERQYDASSIKEIEADWQRLKNTYGWMESSNCCLKCFWHFWFIFSGTLIVFFITIPFVLFELWLFFMIFLVWLLTICCNGKSFGDYFRFFVGNQRINLLTVKNNNNIFYGMWNRVIGFYQLIDLIFSGGAHGLYPYSEKYRKVFGDIFPIFESICVNNYDECVKEFGLSIQLRQNTMAGNRPSTDLTAYLLAHVLDNNSDRWKVCHDATMIFINSNKDDLNENDNIYVNEINKLYEKSDAPTKAQMHFYGKLLYYYFDGIKWDDNDLKYFLKAKDSFLGSFGFPAWLHFFAANSVLLRMAYNDMAKMRSLIIKYGGSKYEALVKYSEKYNINIEILLNAVTSSLVLGAGNSQIIQLTKRLIDAKTKDQDIKLFKSNKTDYVLEGCRYHCPGAFVSNVTNEEVKYKIKEKEYTFPKGTMVSMYLGGANDAVGGSEFGIDRDYGKTMSFHGLESYFENFDELWKYAPRACPGRNIAVNSLKSVVELVNADFQFTQNTQVKVE